MVFTRSLYKKLGSVFEEYVEAKRTRKSRQSVSMAGDELSKDKPSEIDMETRMATVEDKLASIDSTLAKLDRKSVV